MGCQEMWKLLRNLLLAGVLFAGIVKLLAWYEVGRDAQRLTALLSPTAQLTYDGISTALNGDVTLSNVALAFRHEGTVETYRAERVVFESPNVFWLLRHALLAEDSWPARFGIASQGLKLPATMHVDPHWFDPASLVPFENAGCAAAAFSAADFRKMGVNPGDTRQHGEFRYDADGKTLETTVIFIAPEIASVTLSADLRQFEAKSLRSEEALRNLRFGQLSIRYDDAGFLKRRNAFCAQRAGVDTRVFVEQHMTAVRDLLLLHGVEPGSEVLKLYRRLVEEGGRASLLSLPGSNFAMGSWFNATPDDLLRQLNVTARYGDAPPVMVRLTFAAPAPTDGDTSAESAGTPGPTSVTPPSAPVAVPTPTPPPPPSAITQPATVQSATVPASSPSTGPSLPAPMTTTTRNSGVAREPATPVASVVAPKPSAPTLVPGSETTRNGNGLEDIDRAEAKLAPPPKRSAPPASELLPSQPPPPAGSTLALVWKPTIERLPAAAPERRDYEVIEFAALNSQAGRFVRLVTDGGKKVEGYVVAADEAEVELRVSEGGGSARFVVPKARIREVQLIRRSSPPA